ncbi:hypothetical protein SO802_023685 [Lithocarpus litseifolius]|uniref:Uncharacterized protein n=1 Tax=Lithocarpus litseifolius TaxID=425828 RepID=A0AAW2C8W3_9ROSI
MCFNHIKPEISIVHMECDEEIHFPLSVAYVRHILKTTRFLKTMTVSSAVIDSEEKFRVVKELLMFPRHNSPLQKACYDLSNEHPSNSTGNFGTNDVTKVENPKLHEDGRGN